MSKPIPDCPQPDPPPYRPIVYGAPEWSQEKRPMKIHTLTRLRAAHKHEDGAEGVLYMHQWPTGFQELIFANEKLAEQFLARLNQEPASDPRQDRIAETAKWLAQ